MCNLRDANWSADILGRQRRGLTGQDSRSDRDASLKVAVLRIGFQDARGQNYQAAVSAESAVKYPGANGGQRNSDRPPAEDVQLGPEGQALCRAVFEPHIFYLMKARRPARIYVHQ